MLHLALYQPAIPQNTGNIGRLCVGMNTHLHIIGPTAFDLSDKAVRRAGLDYWPHLKWTLHDTPEVFLDWLSARASLHERQDPIAPHNPDPWLITKFGSTRFDQAPYRDGDALILGNENTGLPQAWHDRWHDRRVMIPIQGPIRSYNLANTAAIVLAHASVRA